jgi:hypothetical protein
MDKKYKKAIDIRNAMALFNLQNGTAFLLRDLYAAIVKSQRRTTNPDGSTVRGVSRSYVSWGLRSKSNLLDLQIDEAFTYLEFVILGTEGGEK